MRLIGLVFTSVIAIGCAWGLLGIIAKSVTMQTLDWMIVVGAIATWFFVLFKWIVPESSD